MNKYEQLIEHIINDNEQAAKELFHQIVVEKSRDIYESLMDAEIGGNQAQSFVQDITHQDEAAQEHGLGEDDEEAGEIKLGDMDDMDDEETFGGDDECEHCGGDGCEHCEGEHDEHNEIESKIDDLTAQLEQLKSMLAGDEHAEEHEEESDEEHSDFDMEEPMHAEKSMHEAKKMKSKKETKEEDMKESYRKSEVEIMQEYVNKIGEIYKQEPAQGEGKTVGTGGDEPTVNKDGVVRKQGPKFDGETADNLVRGDHNESPDGKPYKMPKNEYSKGETEQPLASKDGGYKNKIGGNTPWNKNMGKVGADKHETETGKNVGAQDTMGKTINTKSELKARK